MRQTLIFTLISLFLLASATAFVYVSDPYGLWGQRYFQATQSKRLDPRILQPLKLAGTKYDLVFLGSSRVREGFDTRNMQEKYKAYNAGFSGATVYELGKLMQIMGNTGYAGTVIVGLDFFGTAPSAKLLGASIDGPLAGEPAIVSKIKTLLDKDSLLDSVRNIFNQNPSEQEPVFFGSYKGGDSHARFIEGITSHYITYLGPFDPHKIEVENDILASLDNGVRSLAKSGAHIIWFVTPEHASRLYLNKMAGLSAQYENFVYQLAQMTLRINQDFPSALDLWDMNACKGALLEPVPISPEKTMKYFFDSNHFTPAYGVLLTQAMLEGYVDGEISAVKIKPETIDKNWIKDWEACHTALDPELEKIVAGNAQERCRVNRQWCEKL